MPLVAWQVAIGTLPVWVIALGFETLDFSRVTWVGWGCLVYVAVVAQCAAYLAWFRALRLLPAGVAATGSLLVPVIGVFSSARRWGAAGAAASGGAGADLGRGGAGGAGLSRRPWRGNSPAALPVLCLGPTTPRSAA